MAVNFHIDLNPSEAISAFAELDRFEQILITIAIPVCILARGISKRISGPIRKNVENDRLESQENSKNNKF